MEDLWRWRAHVMRCVARRAPTAEHAADAVAGAYAVAWQRLHAVPIDTDSARAWLCVTAWRVLANLRRRDDHQAKVADALRYRSLVSVTDDVGEDRMALMDAYRALAPADRQILALAATGGATLAELGRTLGCTPTAAGVRLSRARRRLARAIQL